MKNFRLWTGVAALMLAGCTAGFAASAKPVRVLIFSGQNNHNWRETTPKLKSILEAGGQFQVDVTEHPEQCDATQLAEYDVLLSNWNTFGNATVTNWPAATRDAIVSFVRAGRGWVTVHAGGSSFYDWPDYQQLAGAVWGEQTRHGMVHTNVVNIVTTNHPITAGLESFVTCDEFWDDAKISRGAKLLAEVVPKVQFGGSGKPEPVALAEEFGRGRAFCLLLGHDRPSMESAGFEELLRRGTEWAASGKVSGSAVPMIQTKKP